MSAIEKQRIFGVILLVLAVLMVGTVIAWESWERHRARRPRLRCGDPGCLYCTGVDRSVEGLTNRALDRSAPRLRSVQ